MREENIVEKDNEKNTTKKMETFLIINSKD